MDKEVCLDVQGLTKRFGDFVAVSEVDFKIRKGSIFGFLGPNGAGKSTTIRMLLGILKPTEGRGEVLGYDILTQSAEIRAGWATWRRDSVCTKISRLLRIFSSLPASRVSKR